MKTRNLAGEAELTSANRPIDRELLDGSNTSSPAEGHRGDEVTPSLSLDRRKEYSGNG